MQNKFIYPYNIRSITYLLFSIIFFTSCLNVNKNDVEIKSETYFQIESFIQNIQLNMNNLPPISIQKTVIVNGKPESIKHKYLEEIEDVFKFISDNDINKPAFIGIYNKNINTYEINNKNIITVTYRLEQNAKAAVKLLRIFYKDSDKNMENIIGMTIIRNEVNNLYNSHHTIDVRLNSLYLTSINIKSEQDILFFNKGQFLVNLEIEKPYYDRIKSNM